MRVRFWGTRGSIAKPGPTTIRYGGNTSCVEVRTRAGTLLVLDCGTGAHGLGHALEGARTGRPTARPPPHHPHALGPYPGHPVLRPALRRGQRVGRLRAARAPGVRARHPGRPNAIRVLPGEPRPVRGDRPLPRSGGG